MRPRTELALAFGGLIAVGVAAAVFGLARAGADTSASERSTFVTGPEGLSALREALRHFGVQVVPVQQRTTHLDDLLDRRRDLLAIVDPIVPPSAPEQAAIVAFNGRAALLLAGSSSEALMRCFGYRTKRHFFDSLPLLPQHPQGPWVHATLATTDDSSPTDSTRAADAATTTCQVPRYRSRTVLLTSRDGPVAVRLERADSGRDVIVLADGALLSNATLRNTDGDTFALDLFVGKYDRVLFDEYHQGFGPHGSLAAATLAWSRTSPWGWAIWQLAAVGTLALLFGAIRFGPAIPVIVRVRRSPLEHVQALATALSAARGHDQAIDAIVRGLRRRLAPPRLRTRHDSREWLQQLAHHSTTAAQHDAITTLWTLTTPGQPRSSVLAAANAAEDLWRTLHS